MLRIWLHLIFLRIINKITTMKYVISFFWFLLSIKFYDQYKFSKQNDVLILSFSILEMRK